MIYFPGVSVMLGRHKKIPVSLLWLLVTCVFGLLSWLFASLFAISTLGMGLLLLGTIVSFCIACAQMLFMGKRLLSVNWSRWLLISTAAGTFSWIVVCASVVLMNVANISNGSKSDPSLHSGYIAPFVIASLSGLVYGAIQGYGFHVKKYYIWWCLANAVGLGAGTVLGLQVADILVPPRSGMLLNFTDVLRLAIMGGAATFMVSVLTSVVVLALPDTRTSGGPIRDVAPR